MFSARTAMLMLATLFSAGAWAQLSEGTTFQLIPNGSGLFKAVIHGNTTSDCGIEETAGPILNEIVCEREFKVGVPATIVLPFPTKDFTVTGGNFYEFACVEWNSDKGQWVASMKQVDENNLLRNTPYIIVPTSTTLNFNMNGNTVKAFTDVATVTCDCWSFVGTYKMTYWIDASVNAAETDLVKEVDHTLVVVGDEPGDYYGFAATDGTAVGGGSVAAGEFVKCSGDGSSANTAFILPMRAYLKFVGDENCPANKDTQMLQRKNSAAAILPTRIAVVLLDKNGEVTSVGTISEKTGEITFEGWFTLDGIKLPAEPTKSGIYIHNGKKVVVK